MIPSKTNRITIAELAAYPERLDVRSPAEFAEDHLPGALSAPVLSNEERAQVGTLYAQAGSFVAKRIGAAIVSRNIATLLETLFADRPRDWAPLVYCWRGGKRSGSLTHVLNEIGWRAVQLDGGYRAYRRHVRERLQEVPAAFRFRVVCGLTGSGKSRLLAALRVEGAQVLDLEQLAAHRGSLLGDLPDAPQPGQKAFETALLAELEKLDPGRLVYVESESRRIGRLQVPESLLAQMREASCLRIELAERERIALLREEYAHFLDDLTGLGDCLAPLAALHGRNTIDRWLALATAHDWDAFVGELLVQHYDPVYARSIENNFPRHADARIARPAGHAFEHFRELARTIIAADTRDAPTTVDVT